MNTSYIALDSAYTLIHLFVVILSGNLRRLGLAVDFSKHLLHQSGIIVFTDPLVNGFTIGLTQAFWAGGDLIKQLLHRSFLFVCADSLVDGLLLKYFRRSGLTADFNEHSPHRS